MHQRNRPYTRMRDGRFPQTNLGCSKVADETIKRILRADVYAVARETPLEPARFLSERLGQQVLIKREDLQSVFSFKIRGAYNRIRQLTAAEQARGVIAASAGNHAQGVALAAQHLGMKAVIVMPKTTPDIKVNSVKAFGADVRLMGDTFDEAYAYSQTLVEQEGLSYIHPYDDPEVIAGQGTVGVEMLRQAGDSLDAIFVPVGGGGLIAGVAAYVKYLRPEIKVIGVESTESASLAAALAAKERVRLPQVGIFADGVAVAQVGEHTWELCKDRVDEVILVSPDEICAAIKDLFVETRTIAEPAGALATAGLKKYAQREGIVNQRLAAVISGANVNFDRLRYIAEVAEVGEGREVILAVTISEKPGSFRAFCRLLGKRAITEFNYRYADEREAQIYVGIKLDRDETRDQLLQILEDAGYPVVDLSDDDTAKYHVRHMVGGHPPAQVADERIYRFEFPERPGALMNFLDRLGQKWNISLFHYRNHGAASGRVLVGLQVSEVEIPEFQQAAEEIGYPYCEESSNPAYRLFLARKKA